MIEVLSKSKYEWLPRHVLFLAYHGSLAYGTSTPKSDMDIRGVAVPPATYFHGFDSKFEQAEFHVPDCIVYDVRKFFRLVLNANPHVLELLWVDPKDHLIVHPTARFLFENREAFLSKRVRNSYEGYAIQHILQLEKHHRWLTNPPTPPTRAEFHLPEHSVLTDEDLRKVSALTKKSRRVWDFAVMEKMVEPNPEPELSDPLEAFLSAARKAGYSDSYIRLVQREQAFKARQDEVMQYQSWLSTRNVKRTALEEAYGYDTKSAAHLVRLLRTIKEILTTREVIVRRPDAEELLAIRNGAWTYDQVIGWAKEQLTQLNQWASASTLPDQPDTKLLEAVCERIVTTFLGLKHA